MWNQQQLQLPGGFHPANVQAGRQPVAILQGQDQGGQHPVLHHPHHPQSPRPHPPRPTLPQGWQNTGAKTLFLRTSGICLEES